MRKSFIHTYNNIISIENLLEAWKEFIRGKKNRKDVQEFEINFMGNILSLHNDLRNKIYRHGGYESFNIFDPKPRSIHKATVRDRIMHHALYRILYPFFDRTFISDSFSCRVGKGTHKAIKRFESFGKRVSKNNTKTTWILNWILKCDIRKFFHSIDHQILIDILRKHISDSEVLMLLMAVIKSFHSTKEGTGLPLGNLTSQILVNIYMNEFDQWMKHTIKTGHYIRYADDFVIFDTDKDKLLELTPRIADFLEENLKLQLHPNKVFIKTLSSGVDFIGWVHFSDHRVLRTVTKRRMFKNIEKKKDKPETIQSYLGLLKHGNASKLKDKVNILFKVGKNL